MQLGMVGLGKMGGNMRERLRRAGHEVVGYDKNAELCDVGSLEELVSALQRPRSVWVMVPAGAPTTEAVFELSQLLDPNDVIVDGGNSKWTADKPRAELLARQRIGFVDAGVSGGVWGLDYGYAIMVGGAPEHVDLLMPIFHALKPFGNDGFVHAGPVAGAGHFAKMTHNAIEYAIMQAWGEGFELLVASGLMTDIPAVFNSWRQGTVVRSWLLDLLCNALDGDPTLSEILGVAKSSGEAQWALEAALGLAVPMPAVAAALFARNVSCQEGNSPAMRVVAALRDQFGGHGVVSAR